MIALRIALMLVLALSVSTGARAQSAVSDRPDHTIFTSIESEPPGIEILAPPADEGDLPVRLGVTPHVAVVELRWESAVLGKLWRKMTAWSPGGVCVSTYTEATKSYDLTLRFLARRGGVTNLVEIPLVSFEYQKDVDYDKLDFIPSRRIARFTWDDPEPAASKSGTEPAARKVKTVMMAKAGQGETQFGAVTVVCTVPDAVVSAGDIEAGKAPVRMILGEGEHVITVRKEGYRTWTASIPVTPSGEDKLTAALEALK